MIAEIQNIFSRQPGYNCFACGPNHPFGLKLKFYYDDETGEVFSKLHPDDLFAGFPGILHGGIQATILDEIAFWGAWARHSRSGFTYSLEISYKKKCPVGNAIEARGKISDINRKLVSCEAKLWDPNNTVVFTHGKIVYYLPSQDPRT